MARKSGWQQFTDNFSSTYDAVNKFSEEGAIRDINERSVEEQFDDTGAVTGYKYGDTLYNTMDDKGGLLRPTDSQIQSQNFKDMQTVMSRHGNWKGAQEMGLSQANLEAKQEANRLAMDTHQFNVDQAAANLEGTKKENVGKGLKNTVDEVEGRVKISQAERDMAKNEIYTEYSNLYKTEGWENNPEAASKWMADAAFRTGDMSFYDTVKKMHGAQIHQKLNAAAQLMAGVKAALSKGQAGGQEELMALIDAQDGIQGNVRFDDTDESGAVSIVELDPEGNPTNAAPWAGKDWEDFSQNVMKRLDPVTALSITTKQIGVEKDQASVGLINAQTLEALQKASGAGDPAALAKIKQKAVTDFMDNADGPYAAAQRKGDSAAMKAILGLFKSEMENALSGSATPNTGGISGGSNTGTPTAGNGGDKGILGKLSNLNNTTEGMSTDTGASVKPVTKKVLTKAQTSELATLDKEVSDIQAKVVELSNVRGLQAGGKARNEIQKLRKRITGIEQRKYKIQN
jgi:hypothetical protein